MKVLGCDLGGTNTRLRIAECKHGSCRTVVEKDYASGNYPGLVAILDAFITYAGEAGDGLAGATIAVAGPIVHDAHGQQARVTNLPWVLHSAKLSETLGIERVSLINDFEAIGYGVPTLGPEDVVTLQAGQPVQAAPIAVLGAGTGLGQASLLPLDHGFQVRPTEGGHVDFAPVDDEQIALLEHLRRQHARVSVENILCGSGLVRLHEFWCAYHRTQPGAALVQAMNRQDPAAAISRAGLANEEPTARGALDLFVRIYGAQAGNVALSTLARGGIYLAGGIAPKILQRLQDGPFLEAFRAKAPMEALMNEFPIHVIVNSRVGLAGAIQRAAALA